MRIYLYETSSNIQEPWPSDLYFHGPLTSYFGQIIKVKIFVQGRISRPINGIASWYFIWGCISMRPARIYKCHDMLTSDLGRFSMVYNFCHRFLSSTDGRKLIFYQRLYLCETISICFHAKGSCSGGGGGARGQSLGPYRFLSYISKTSWWMNIIFGILVQCDTHIDLKLCM